MDNYSVAEAYCKLGTFELTNFNRCILTLGDLVSLLPCCFWLSGSLQQAWRLHVWGNICKDICFSLNGQVTVSL